MTLSIKVAYKARSQNWADKEQEEFTKTLADEEMRLQFH